MERPDFVEVFEENWQKIRDEYLNCSLSPIPFPDRSGLNLNSEEKWKVSAIYHWPTGDLIEQYARELPFTKTLVDEYISSHCAVSISILEAGGFIPAHTGANDGCLRMHLGLIIPAGDTGICVDGKVYNWREGECFIFDDTKEHFAWNRTNDDRVVLLIDFIPR